MSLDNILLASFLIIVLISVDVFMVGFSYGVGRMRVGWWRLTIISAVGNLMLGAALLLGYSISTYIDNNTIRWITAIMFLMIGLFKLAATQNTNTTERAQGLKEAILLGALLAIDGLGAGFAIGLDVTLLFVICIVAISFVGDIFLFRLGQWAGQKLTTKTQLNLGWLPGVVFIVIALIQLIA